MTTIRVADYIASRLSEEGMNDVFLVTGGGAMHLNDAFGRHPDIEVTCCHHEQACAMAAESYYRSSNKPAILNVTTGPGGINAMNGVWGAFVDSCSMFVVSGQVKLSTYSGYYELPMRQLGDQEVNIVDLVKPITKFAITVTDPNDIRWIIDKALYVMNLGRPGPVWVDVPIDVSSSQINPSLLRGWPKDHVELSRSPSIHPSVKYDLEHFSYARSQMIDFKKFDRDADTGVIGTNLSMMANLMLNDIESAKRPVLFAGNGIRFSGQTDAFLELAVRLGIPIVSGWNAHDIIPTSHPCYAGRPGTVGDRAGNFTVQNADLVIVLGSRLNIRQISYNYKNFAKNAHVYMVDIDRSELDKPTLNDLISVKIHEDLAVFMPFLMEKTEEWKPKIEHHAWLGWCREKVDRYPVVSGNLHTEHYLNPYKFIHDFSKEWEEDDIIVTGNGSACVIPFQCAEIKPNQRLYTNSGDASMGYDLPAAIGAAIANPDKRIICLAGDGSIMMNLQELQTIQTLNLNIKIIVLNNNGYLSIKQTQKNYFSDCEFGTEPGNGVGFPKFARVGESFDINSVIVRNITDWKSSYVKQLLTSNNPALIEVMIDPNQQFAPKLMAKKLADGSMLAPSLENMFPFLSDEEMRENMIGDDA
jgi:acetolactate synthase-1/2/3 large subunit